MTATPSQIVVRVAGELELDPASLPPHVLLELKGALTIENEERTKASVINQFGWWDMPETVALWREETRRSGQRLLCLPRGFAAPLAAGMERHGLQVAWDDHRTTAPAACGYFQPFYVPPERDYQLDAVTSLLRSEQGFWAAPAGSGKTVGALLAMAYAGQRTLVIVDKSALLEQWRSRAAQFFDFPTIEEEQEDGLVLVTVPMTKGDFSERTVGKIGEDIWEERDLTICLRQTLDSRDWSLDATKWWQNWGMVVHDEGHHLAGATMQKIARKITSKYHVAISATPAPSPARGQIVHALVGPVVHETPRQLLYDRGVLMRPSVRVIHGELDTVFWPDHEARKGSDGVWKCMDPKCRKQAKHRHRNNYASVLKALVESPERNAKIAARILSERGHVHLVPSSQLKHLNLIRNALLEAGWPKEKVWVLRGEENAKGLSQNIVQAIQSSDEAVLLSTVAEEGLDVPPIDRVHMVFPVKQARAVVQISGRGERVWPGKEDSQVLDWHEPDVVCFAAQFEERYQTFRAQGYEVFHERGDLDDPRGYPAEAMQ